MSPNRQKTASQRVLCVPKCEVAIPRPHSSRPLFIGRTSPAFGRPTPIQPFPNPDMDGINRHATASQSQPRLICLTITFQPPEAARRTIPRLANTHDTTILRVEYKNETISAQPSSIRDSPTTTASSTTTHRRETDMPAAGGKSAAMPHIRREIVYNTSHEGSCRRR